MDLQQINIFMPLSYKFSESCEINAYFVNNTAGSMNIYVCKEENDKCVNNVTCCREWINLSSKHKFAGLLERNNVQKYEHNSYSFYISIINNDVTLKYLRIGDREYEVSSLNIFILSYDYSAFVKSEDSLLNKCQSISSLERRNHFEYLNTIVKHNNGICWKKHSSGEKIQSTVLDKWKLLFFISKLSTILCNYSNICVQLECFIRSVYWVFHCVWKEKKLSVRAGNLLTSLVVDFFGGLFILYWINQLSVTPVNDLYYIIELIVNNLQSLLEWLMGSPAGLKLNHAFNTMLGKFFLYHIGLWWIFLVIIKGFLETALNIMQYLGMLGITFQTAVLADLLSLSSFHVYCIYTYAARLYNIQISGLIALWRLFLGRKHNPLRGGVDSCEYNHHQLFVGTLVFTILLFLLPTTFLYYVVFTSFRVCLVLLGGFLTRLRCFIQSLPLYLVSLWLAGSPRIAGNIKVTADQHRNDSKDPVYLQITLQTASLFHLISEYHPSPIARPKRIKWTQLFTCLCHGYLLYPV